MRILSILTTGIQEVLASATRVAGKVRLVLTRSDGYIDESFLENSDTWDAVAGDYVTRTTTQTITGEKTFTESVVVEHSVTGRNINVLPFSDTGNAHLWFRKQDNTSQGLLYWDRNAESMVLRSYKNNAFSGTQMIVDQDSVQWTIPGLANGMRITSTGLGIGATSPITRMEAVLSDSAVYGPTTAARNILRLSNSAQVDGAYASIDFAVRNAAGNFGNAAIAAVSVDSGSSADLAFQVRNGGQTLEAVRITSIGNVGIGTPSPSGKLEVNGRLVVSEASGSVARLVADLGQGDALTFFNLDITGVSTENAFIRVFRETNTTGAKAFDLYNGTGSAGVTTRLGVDGLNSFFNISGGNVGIGTTLPTEKLEVNGRARADQFVVDAVTALGNISGSTTINLGTSNILSGTVTGNATLAFTAPPGPCTVQLLLTNSGAGNTITLPGSVTFVSGAQTEDDGAKYVLSLIFDGTNYWASWAT